MSSTIRWTKTDEAPMLASYSLLPIVKAFLKSADIDVEVKDISLAGRILALFAEQFPEEQRREDALKALGELTHDPKANIIKLPNISASIPQLVGAIKELQSKSFQIPDYVQDDKELSQKYSKVLGSAVNPVLREGNSDRRVAKAVKEYAKENPHSMGKWSPQSKTHVAHMERNDFFGNERSFVSAKEQTLKIEFHGDQGAQELKSLKVLKDEIIDATYMGRSTLRDFFEQEIKDAKEKDLLLSLHMKATMMKVSDPIIFGECVRAYYAPIIEKYSKELESIEVNFNNGVGDLYSKMSKLNDSTQHQIIADIEKLYTERPELAMVDSDKGITNLHVPSDVIIDASMPAMIRTSGQMWNRKGETQDTKAIIPDRSYAGIYQETIEFCKKHGAFDPSTMGSVSNVGLMAKKAEEYGSHDKTFTATSAGTFKVIEEDGSVALEHRVEEGDIWRMCQTKDVAVRDWVKLAVNRAWQTKTPAIFWLNSQRAHDSKLIEKVKLYLEDHNLEGVEIKIMSPAEATRFTCERVKEGKDTISVTGNVLRDYLTDLFPILELGTSAKMLSIVPLLAGGGLFETGAGGSAPKHVDQLIGENHLRWDSLGEFLALEASLDDIASKNDDEKVRVLADALGLANKQYLSNNKSPSRKVKELDNRGSHYYLAKYWSAALAEQDENKELKSKFAPVYEQLRDKENEIVAQLENAQGKAVDIGGYYMPDEEKITKVMRPSIILNDIINSI